MDEPGCIASSRRSALLCIGQRTRATAPPWAEHVVASRVASSEETTGPLHPFRESLNHFVQSGQPVMLYDAGEADPFQGVVFEYCGQRGTVVSSRLCRKGESCQRELDRGYCDECLRACSSKPMRKQVLKRSYWV